MTYSAFSPGRDAEAQAALGGEAAQGPRGAVGAPSNAASTTDQSITSSTPCLGRIAKPNVVSPAMPSMPPPVESESGLRMPCIPKRPVMRARAVRNCRRPREQEEGLSAERA